MSAVPENEFDLEHLFLPAWAQQPSSVKQYAQYDGREEQREERRGERRPGRRPPPRGDAGGRRRDEGGPRPGRERFERREPAQPLPQINVSLLPDEKGVESLARQIRMTGRA